MFTDAVVIGGHHQVVQTRFRSLLPYPPDHGLPMDHGQWLSRESGGSITGRNDTYEFHTGKCDVRTYVWRGRALQSFTFGRNKCNGFRVDAQWIHRLALLFIPGVGVQSAKILLAYAGGEDAIFHISKKELLKMPGLSTAAARSVWQHKDEALDRAAREWKFIRTKEIRPVFFTDADFPSRLRHTPDGPILLFVEGNAELNPSKALAVVGSRKANAYGLSLCEQIITDLAAHDVCIVSGLAYGMDIMAHRTALATGLPTLGVLCHGLDRMYPGQHAQIAEKMKTNGALITEFASGTQPDRENFPRRNRIVAGMVDALLVVQTATSGGSLITASLAMDYNRDVFAVPGHVHDPYSAGCHALIKSNKAALVESAEDIIHAMNWQPKKPASIQTECFPVCTDDEQALLDILRSHGELPIDELGAGLKWTPARTSSVLLQLEFRGLVKALPGKRYRPG